MADSVDIVEKAVQQVAAAKLTKGQAPTFTIEEIRPILERKGMQPGQFGPFIAKLTQEGIIRKTGETVNSSVPESKGRLLQVYEPTAQALGTWKLQKPSAPTPSPALSFSDGVRQLMKNLSSKGFVIDETRLTNILLSARVKPFIFLYGPTGTGKSRLPELLASELHGTVEIVPVRPNWSDSGELIGYYSVTRDEFVAGPLLRVLDAAIDKPTQIFVLVLDEMNLARVEHYLSEMLSVMESRHRTAEGIRTRPIPLETLPKGHERPEGEAALIEEYDRLSRLYLPSNVFIFGTVNIDETTFNFSPKVLDRGFPVEMVPGPVDQFPADTAGSGTPLPAEFSMHLFDPPGRTSVPLDVVEARQWARGDEARQGVWKQVLDDLERLQGDLLRGGFEISYRTRDSICLYIDAWHTLGAKQLLSYDSAFDFCILQKILPKLRGTRSSHNEMLQGLWELLTDAKVGADPQDMDVPPAARFPRSANKVLDMMRQYADGSFSYWLIE